MGLQLLQQELTSTEPGLTLSQSYLLFSEVYLSLFPDVASPEFAEVGELGQTFAGCGIASGWQLLYRRKCDVELIVAWGAY